MNRYPGYSTRILMYSCSVRKILENCRLSEYILVWERLTYKLTEMTDRQSGRLVRDGQIKSGGRKAETDTVRQARESKKDKQTNNLVGGQAETD